jgi:nucleotide-binding universal stress UspA family protein
MNTQLSNPASLLIAYDGSDLARHAVERAGALFPGSSAHVLSVYEPVTALVPTPTNAAVAVIADPDQSKRAAEAAEMRARELALQGSRLAEQAGLTATGTTAAARGTAGVADAIVERARNANASTIVMGSHGRSAIGAALLGSVSHAVLHRATVPVLVVPGDADSS